MTPTPAPPAPTTPPAPRRDHADTPETGAWFDRLAALGEGTERSLLLNDLVAAWLPMAHRIALRYRDRGEETEDLRQVAALGLVKALDRFDPTRGRPFAAYAVPVVTGELRRHFRDNTWDLHVPRRTKELRNLVRRIADHLGLGEAEVRRGAAALDGYSCLSLDAPVGDTGRPLGETLGARDGEFERATERVAVQPYLRALPARERAVLHLRFFRDLTQRQIAQRLSVSQMQVSRILRRVCDGAREHVEGTGPAPGSRPVEGSPPRPAARAVRAAAPTVRGPAGHEGPTPLSRAPEGIATTPAPPSPVGDGEDRGPTTGPAAPPRPDAGAVPEAPGTQPPPRAPGRAAPFRRGPARPAAPTGDEQARTGPAAPVRPRGRADAAPPRGGPGTGERSASTGGAPPVPRPAAGAVAAVGDPRRPGRRVAGGARRPERWRRSGRPPRPPRSRCHGATAPQGASPRLRTSARRTR
ncbi:sigma-70 family RNA polymerase sigma factor [Streptomyces bohaiensis]|uniref:sigma-70 family RNA polymerase sigma factor n=1 Tax=Streptomyces bohaiensis TaxID=1431344 RepID=UPI003B7A94BA